MPKQEGQRKGEGQEGGNLQPCNKLSKYDEVYINTLKFESYAAGETTHPTTIKVHHALEGTMFINGKEAKILVDTGRIEAICISAAFVSTYSIPCTEMKEPTKILMAMKRSRLESHKESSVDQAVGKPQTK